MPGICGFYNLAPNAEAPQLLDRMQERLRSQFTRVSGCFADLHGCFGLANSSLGILSNTSQPASLPGDRRMAVLDGEIFDAESAARELHQQDVDVRPDDLAAILLGKWARGGTKAVATLDGSFAAAIADPNEQKLTLISDSFGTRPLYYAHTANRFIFSSQIVSLLADPEVSRDPDWTGVAQFFTFGHYFQNETSLAAVKILPAAAVLVFDARRNKVTIERYWHGAARVGKLPADRQAAFEAIDDAMFRSVQKCAATPGAGLGISLSGGLDARTILGLFEQPAGRVKTVCMGMPGNRDHRTSTQLASIVGCEHHNHTLDSAFLKDFERHLTGMVQLTDGQYLSQCIVMPTLPLYQQLGIGILMRGHAGELMHLTKAYNYSLDNAGLAVRDEAGLEEWLWSGLQAHLQTGVDGPLFARRELQNSRLARETLRAALAETSGIERPKERVAHLFLDQRVRRETMLSMLKFRSIAEPRLPYLDRVLVERLLALPLEWRLDDELQNHILQKRQPKFCNVENTNTGTVLGAGWLRRKSAGLSMRVLSKLGVPGYQPYERLGLWLRRDVAPLVRRILLSEQCLDRGIFVPDTVKQVVDRHLGDQRNHTYLIMAIMIYEVGQRTLVDEQPSDNGAPHPKQAVTA